MLAVAQRMENAYENIVHDAEQCAKEIIAEIGNGFRQHFLRSAHPAQDRWCEGDAQHSQCQTSCKTHGDVGMDGLAHGVIIPGSKTARDDDSRAHGDTVKEADHHKDQTSGGAHRRQGGVPKKMAHNPGVKGIVELLEYISQKNRKSEQKHPRPDGALGQRALTFHHGKMSSRKIRCTCNKQVYSFGGGLSSIAEKRMGILYPEGFK